MQGYSQLFKGKRITLLGLGLLGRGVGDAEFLAQSDADVLVTDKKTEAELQSSVDRLQKYTNISFRLGGHDRRDFIDTDMVIKAAGVPLDSPEVAAARNEGIPVYMSTALFAQIAREMGAIIVGVTETRGKSTVTHMIHHCLLKAGKRVHLGGNIRGVSTLALLPEIKKGDIVVLELDSWQLQGFGDIEMSPDIAIFTNLMPDHLNYYPDMESYFHDKANIFRYQKKGDTLFVGGGISKIISRAKPPQAPLTPAPLSRAFKLRVLGEHNKENASFAAATLHALDLSENEIKEGLESFDAVEGRLQFVRELSGVHIYNDNNSTTPEATIAALKAIPTRNKNIVLILGGADKGLELEELIKTVNQRCAYTALLHGTGTERLRDAFENSDMYHSLEEAFVSAMQHAKEGQVVLFSPAFASFGMFRNEYDRNDQFMRLVGAL